MTPTVGLEALKPVLAEAQRRSLIGASLTLSGQIAHSEAFLRILLLETIDRPVLELGSGGGLPGLVMAVESRDLRLVLLDSKRRSTEFLNWAVGELQLSPRVSVVNARAEQLGRDTDYRGQFAAVVARSFGPPAVTAESAAGFLRVGGRLIVSEPPANTAVGASPEGPPSADRWPTEGCGEVGLTPEAVLRGEFGFAVLRQTVSCPDRYPRRPGIPSKRPLFG